VTGIVSVVALTAGLVVEATGGQLGTGSSAAASTAFTGVSIDSRTIQPGMLFVAIRGDRVDGHAYVAEAVGRGAAGVVVSAPADGTGDAVVIRVDDTTAALQQVGREVRRRSHARVVAITGSAGKTSTKELIADLLSAKYRVFRNRGNLNNHIGLPISLTELASGPDIGVVELGMNHPGEIRMLIGLAEPDVRVWTNVGDAHIGHFGTRDAVAEAKAEILESATRDTIAVVNSDDALIKRHTRGFAGRLVTFGTDRNATVRLGRMTDRGFDGVTADVHTTAGPIRLEIALPGRAHLMNVLAAVAVALEFGVDAADISAGVAAARAVPRRGAIARLPNGARVVDDTYNASPAAVLAMIQALSTTATAGRRIAVIGEMLELGEASLSLHEECGRAAAQGGVDLLVAVGGAAADGLVSGAVDAGLAPDRTRRFADAASASVPVVELVRAGDVVLVKGSRGTRTDVIADALVAGRTH